GGGSLAAWYPSLEDWLGAWLRRSRAEWVAAFKGAVPRDADPAFVEAARRSAGEGLGGGASSRPLLAPEPGPHDELWVGRGGLRLAARGLGGAEAAFAQAAALSRDEGLGPIGRCLVAEARGDAAARLQAADEGLAGACWWSSRLQLLRHRR